MSKLLAKKVVDPAAFATQLEPKVSLTLGELSLVDQVFNELGFTVVSVLCPDTVPGWIHIHLGIGSHRQRRRYHYNDLLASVAILGKLASKTDGWCLSIQGRDVDYDLVAILGTVRGVYENNEMAVTQLIESAQQCWEEEFTSLG